MNTTQKLRPRTYIGPIIDRYLDSEGSIAQAVDQQTIFISSTVLGMSAIERRRILLHELAHTQQLARAGNDATSALEDEAWEAADAWSSGRMYRVRGRARMRLNATAIIQGGEHGQNASSWYNSNPIEPIGGGSSLTVKDTVVLENSETNRTTLEAVLDMVIHKNDKQIVIVCHGWDAGLSLPLYKNSDFGTIADNLVRLGSDHSFQKGAINTPVIADDDVFRGASTENVKRLRGKMNQVRNMKLEHVAFRACDMGQKEDTLDAFRDFFGAASVSAPKLLDSYGMVSGSIGGDLAGWVQRHRKLMFRCWTDKGVAFAIKSVQHHSPPTYQILCRAQDRSTLVNWMKAHVADTLAGNNAFVYHGMFDNKVADKEAPVIYFIRDSAFLMNLVNYSG